MTREVKERPAYAITSVDHALRVATMLQLEGDLSVTEVAERLHVARSTAHRLLAMLVYRDFAVPTDRRTYRAGPVLELAAHSRSAASQLRGVALPHLTALVDVVGESANLIIRAGDTARFVASVECTQALRVGNREGMVFPAHRVTGGLVLLAELSDDELKALYAEERFADRPDERPDLGRLRRALERVRSNGFALNEGQSERGIVAVGCRVRNSEGLGVACLSVSMPSVRYQPRNLPTLVTALRRSASAIEADLRG